LGQTRISLSGGITLMPTMQDEMNLDALYVMMKGEWGTRKSTSALSFPTPQYWFSWDQKMRALLIPMKNWGINPTDVEYHDYVNWDDPRKKLENLQANCKYKTIVIDTITSAADSALRQVKSIKLGQTKKGSNEQKGMYIGNISVNEIDDYKAEESALNELVALTKDIHSHFGVHVVLIAHVIRADYRSLDGKTHISRSLVTAGKKIAAKIPAYSDEIYHFNIEESVNADKGGQYAILTTHTGDDYARTGLPLPPKIIFNDQPLYTTHLKPAIEQLKEGKKK